MDRLAMQLQNPNFLATREFYAGLYGEHPYARIDTTPEAVQRMRRNDLVRWHRQHFVANNAFLVVVGDTAAEPVQQAVGNAFGSWRTGTVTETRHPAMPTREGREVVVVNRPESVQSIINIGNLGLERSNEHFVPLRVANQVLGGSAASRLFMTCGSSEA